MQTLEVTDEQHAFIQRLRAALSDEVVGKYGHVRERDALQYLIDHFDADGDLDVAVDPSADASRESDGLEAVTYDESADALDDDSDGDADPAGDGAADDEAAGDGAVGDDSAAAADGTDDEEADGDAESDGEGGGDAESGAADDDDMLNRMMNLLETHDDKWSESDSADYRYSVTLPDGNVEHVQTKDDVRALLFKNY